MITRLGTIIESVIDPEQRQLSKHVFADGKLLPSVRFKILRGWGQISRIGLTTRVLIVGSIGTFNYSRESDVDVTIQWAGPPEKYEDAIQTAITLNGKESAGPHEINYFVRSQIYSDYFDAIYDVIADRWLKGPSETGVDVDKYMARFEEVVSTITADKAELLSDLADYRALIHITDHRRVHQLATGKLKEIERDIASLGDQYLEIWSARKGAFSEPDLKELRDYGHRNALPANVIYLLLRRYCYLHFLHTLYKISDDGVSKSELGDVEDAYKEFGSCQTAREFEESLAVSLRLVN